MQYVMVPVPEAHVAAVERFVAWSGIARAMPEDADIGSVDRVVEEVDAATRSLLVQLARAPESDEELTVDVAAARVGCSAREVMGMVAELNHLSSSFGGANYLVVAQPVDREDSGTAPAFGEQQIIRLKEWAVDRILGLTGVGTTVGDDRPAVDW